MTKAGEGILRGAQDALDYVRGDEGETKEINKNRPLLSSFEVDGMKISLGD